MQKLLRSVCIILFLFCSSNCYSQDNPVKISVQKTTNSIVGIWKVDIPSKGQQDYFEFLATGECFELKKKMAKNPVDSETEGELIKKTNSFGRYLLTNDTLSISNRTLRTDEDNLEVDYLSSPTELEAVITWIDSNLFKLKLIVPKTKSKEIDSEEFNEIIFSRIMDSKN